MSEIQLELTDRGPRVAPRRECHRVEFPLRDCVEGGLIEIRNGAQDTGVENAPVGTDRCFHDDDALKCHDRQRLTDSAA